MRVRRGTVLQWGSDKALCYSEGQRGHCVTVGGQTGHCVPLELRRVLTPLPKTFEEESINRGSGLCTRAFHHTDSKDPDSHVQKG